jgi:hypothetical protein
MSEELSITQGTSADIAPDQVTYTEISVKMGAAARYNSVAPKNVKYNFNFECKNLLSDNQLVAPSEKHSSRSIVVKFKHTDEKISKFDDLINVRANVLEVTNGYYVSSVKKEDVLNSEANADLQYKNNPTFSSEAF